MLNVILLGLISKIDVFITISGVDCSKFVECMKFGVHYLRFQVL